MVLEHIYVVRHGYRSNWSVDPSTGHYNSSVPSPTGIVSDPALASYGVKQAQELGHFLQTVDPPIDLIYSSPFYRCLQTLKPYTDYVAAQNGDLRINVERGVGEFYGLARFDHPSPAPIEVLHEHFDHLVESESPIIPSTKGESIPGLHNRIAYCLEEMIRRADADPSGPKTMLICTHAASMICIGRALTGRMPEDECEEDFKCFTCSFSRFKRKAVKEGTSAEKWNPKTPENVPDVGWKKNGGVGGGWECEVNGDCSFMSGGEERGWSFEMEKQQAGKVTGADI